MPSLMEAMSLCSCPRVVCVVFVDCCVGGKSLCYQIPPLVRNGMCIVVSPLIALMQDQRLCVSLHSYIVRELRDRRIPCCYLSSSQTTSEYRSVMAGLRNAKTPCNALFVTPERFQVAEFLHIVQDLHKRDRIVLIAIDEAHCISTFCLHCPFQLKVGTRLPLRLSRAVDNSRAASWNPDYGAVCHGHIRRFTTIPSV